ncbi:MAG: carbamoyltransferase HypF [Blastocatellia bacterium]|nr:carbamoyltransferase HypF [Blastocatellia bacterium]
MTTRTQILVRGIVQGVGFRPFIHTQAQRHVVKGRVYNDAAGVVIDLEGDSKSIAGLFEEIILRPPPLAVIDKVECRVGLPAANYEDFQILESVVEGAKAVPISVDVATCADCLRELFSPSDRRFRYPFINCTNCGPRFTIVEGVPYDRQRTSMRDFEMCPSCRREYENPWDRRFHAEPIGCSNCGPVLELVDAQGNKFNPRSGEDLISCAQRLLREGKILAVKGLGGFHLVCDALNHEAVNRLRERKYRQAKPFALMAASLAVVRRLAVVSAEEEALLQSVQRPIVLLEKRPDAGLPVTLAPGAKTFGFMLPYTPLHYLLLENRSGPLVMTSGNVSDEPICFENSEAARRLPGIADVFLRHNRRITIRTDDSVARVQAGRVQLLRRSRGYAPAPLRLGFRAAKEILACGAELKNTFCLVRDEWAYLSHHIGDLENLETLDSFTNGISHFQKLFDLHPEVVAYDLHPDYLSTKYALSVEDIPGKVGIQHHHAHIASCLADNRAEGEVIGVAMDGLGWGADGKIWGGEFLVADFIQAERVGHLAYLPLPGGTQAIKEPWRMAAMYLWQAYGDEFLNLNLPFFGQVDRASLKTLQKMAAAGVNCPETSSMGRLFDAVSALLGLKLKVTYEGQAAIELETLAAADDSVGYRFEIDGTGVIHAGPVIQNLVGDLIDEIPASRIAARFHVAVAQLILEMAVDIRDRQKLKRVALSGGVFQNGLLLKLVSRRLADAGFELLAHSRVPAGDGGIALGQAAIANALLAAGRI